MFHNPIYPVSPMFYSPISPVSPMLYSPIYRVSPMFYKPIYRVSPMFFGLRMGATCLLLFKKNMGDLGDEVAHTGYVENISCFRG